MHARDLFSLALTSNHDERSTRNTAPRRPPAAILPRGNEIVVSFGNVRAVVGHDSAMMFDAHNPNTQLLAQDLSKVFEEKMKEALESPDGENLFVDKELMCRAHYIGDPFELVFLEEVLRDVCDTFNRRIRLYEPIVDSLLSRVSNEVFSDSGVHSLVPIKDSLQEFEIHVKSGLDCLTHLLDNDEDMLGLLLTEKAAALEKGQDLHHHLHESVELLLEEYARQLSNILLEINYLLHRVQSKQELVALSLDSYRNRMIRMNVYLSMVGIGLATGTTVAGFYGMNLVNGYEESLTAFNNVVISTSIVGVVLFMGCVSYLSGPIMKKRTMERLDQIETISGALSEMSALDYVVKKVIERGKPMSKDEFRQQLIESRPSGQITEQELELLFSVLDLSKDGFLNSTDDFGKFVWASETEKRKKQTLDRHLENVHKP